MDGTDNVSATSGDERDAVARQAHLAECLDRVRQLALAEQRRDLESVISSELQHLERQDALTAVVAAEVSRGKSLLINALVGAEDLLPVDLDVSTGVHVVVRYDDPPSARVYKRNTTTPLPAQISRIADWISVTGNPENAKAVAYVDVGVPSALLAEGISFIDTPGVGGLNTAHAATTLAAISDGDALVFVLDASAPLSRPELDFLAKAGQRIQTVILVMTKADVFPGWRAILDEDRQLLKKYSPRFADQEIMLVRSPHYFGSLRRRADGNTAAADRLLDLSGIPQLSARLRRDLIRRAGAIRIINGHRLAMTVLWQLDKGCQDQAAALKGDTAPVQALQEKQKELAEHKAAAESWKQVAARGFADVGIQINRELQDALGAFRHKFDTEIATSWRSGRHLSFPAELEADLHLVELRIQRSLADALRQCAGKQAERLGIEDPAIAGPRLDLPERERLQVRQAGPSKAQLAVMGGGILTGAIGLLKSILSFNPTYVFTGVLGVSSSLQSLTSDRLTAQQKEGKRLLQEYAETFQRDCKAAIDDAVRAATDVANEALQSRLQQSLDSLQARIQVLTKQAAQAKEAEAAKTALSERRATIAKLIEENQAGFRDAYSTGRGSQAAQPQGAGAQGAGPAPKASQQQAAKPQVPA